MERHELPVQRKSTFTKNLESARVMGFSKCQTAPRR